MHLRLFSVLLFAVILFSCNAAAQGRCDCSIKTGTCEAAISLSEKSFTLTSNTHQCSRLEGMLNRQTKTTTVMDGKAIEQRSKEKSPPDFWLKTCYVCADSRFPGGARASTTEKSSATARLIGKWCTQGNRDTSYTIAPDSVITTLAFGRSGRKFDKFSCNTSLNQCVGEINGIKNVLAGGGMGTLQ